MAHRARHLVGEAAKRGADVVLALALGLLLSPVLLLAAISVRVTSPGPVLFRQPRVGRDGRTFVMLKLRTMYDECADELHRVSTLVRDARNGIAGALVVRGEAGIGKSTPLAASSDRLDGVHVVRVDG